MPTTSIENRKAHLASFGPCSPRRVILSTDLAHANLLCLPCRRRGRCSDRRHRDGARPGQGEGACRVRRRCLKVEPPNYPPPSTRWAVAGVGLAATGVFYGMGAGLSYAYPDVPGMTDLRKPIIGPWLAVAHSGCGNGSDCTDLLLAMRTVLMVLDGAAQAGSLAVVLEGLFLPTQEPPPAPPGASPSKRTAPPPKPAPGGSEKNLFFVPGPMTVGSGGVGLSVVGRF